MSQRPSQLAEEFKEASESQSFFCSVKINYLKCNHLKIAFFKWRSCVEQCGFVWGNGGKGGHVGRAVGRLFVIAGIRHGTRGWQPCWIFMKCYPSPRFSNPLYPFECFLSLCRFSSHLRPRFPSSFHLVFPLSCPFHPVLNQFSIPFHCLPFAELSDFSKSDQSVLSTKLFVFASSFWKEKNDLINYFVGLIMPGSLHTDKITLATWIKYLLIIINN